MNTIITIMLLLVLLVVLAIIIHYAIVIWMALNIGEIIAELTKFGVKKYDSKKRE